MKRALTFGFIQGSLATVVCMGLAAFAQFEVLPGFYLGLFMGNFFFGAYRSKPNKAVKK